MTILLIDNEHPIILKKAAEDVERASYGHEVEIVSHVGSGNRLVFDVTVDGETYARLGASAYGRITTLFAQALADELASTVYINDGSRREYFSGG